jgi:molybdopterin-guanine dinucleotide biosynthesis protein A
MGRSKASLPFGDETMLARVVRLLSRVVHQVVVVAAVDQTAPDLPDGVRVVRDQQPSLGPLEGLRVGLTALIDQVDAAYVTSCDVPLLSTDFVMRMFAELGSHQAAVPVEGEFHHPLAAVYRPQVARNIEQLLAAGKRRPISLYDEVSTARVPIETLRDVDPDLQTLRNLNHPADYFAALDLAGLPRPADWQATDDAS